MSLLLEALKKAELAKQAAKAGAPAAASEPAPFPESPAPVMTREKLPDISQPLEILTDDLPSSDRRPLAEPARPGLSLQEAETDRPAAEFEPMRPAAEPARASQRAQAQSVFQAKEMDYNPRRPFQITVGALVLVGVGYAGYVWWQLQPRTSLASSATSVVATRAVTLPAQVAAVPPAPAVTQTPATQTPPAAGPSSSSRASKSVVSPIAPVRPPRLSTAPKTSTAAVPTSRPVGPAMEGAPARAVEAMPIAINPPSLVLDPLLEQAYQAFQRNDLAAARDGYLRVLAREPNNRDALLGLAAIDIRSGNLDSAETRYLKLLDINPRDSHAVAGLVALRNQLDPVALESRLKTLLASQPEAAHLHFSLGNQYARQSRWPEAQAAYFRAYSAEPENADYAFNLAVSLDQLRRTKPALDYYQRALDLANRHPANFNRAQTLARVQELSR